MRTDRPVLRVLTGCTAAGKTEWALRWAEARGAEIVSCDSLLFYRGMDIGTAKPTADEQARVKHHLIDVCDVTEQMNITRYVTMAQAALREVRERGREVLVTGGSGFYLKAFFGPVADELKVPDAMRTEVAAMTAEAARGRLLALNPGGVGGMDTANPRRVARALERCLVSGRTVTELAAEFAQQPSPFADWEVELTEIVREPADLEQRIAQRVATMLREGLVEEVVRLRAAGLKENPSASRAIGYRETIDMIEGRLAADKLAAEIVRNTRGLVKKQRTWFRTQMPEHRLVDARSARDASELFEGRR